MRENLTMKPMTTKRVTIRGERWQIRVFNNDLFFDRYGSECAGITLIDLKIIDLPLQEVNFVTILHEIFHAYASYLHLNSANIEGHQAEEIFAELFSSYGVQMINAATSLTEGLGSKLKIEQADLVANLSEDQRMSVLLKTKLQKQRKRKT
jgi:hypothetical protein